MKYALDAGFDYGATRLLQVHAVVKLAVFRQPENIRKIQAGFITGDVNNPESADSGRIGYKAPARQGKHLRIGGGMLSR